jgi:hypothetical protein
MNHAHQTDHPMARQPNMAKLYTLYAGDHRERVDKVGLDDAMVRILAFGKMTIWEKDIASGLSTCLVQDNEVLNYTPPGEPVDEEPSYSPVPTEPPGQSYYPEEQSAPEVAEPLPSPAPDEPHDPYDGDPDGAVAQAPVATGAAPVAVGDERVVREDIAVLLRKRARADYLKRLTTAIIRHEASGAPEDMIKDRIFEEMTLKKEDRKFDAYVALKCGKVIEVIDTDDDRDLLQSRVSQRVDEREIVLVPRIR